METKLFSEKTLRAHFLTVAVYEVLKTYKTFKADNAKAAQTFYSVVSTYVVNHDSMKKLPTYKSVQEAFENFDIHDGLELVNAILTDKEELKKLRYHVEKIKSTSTQVNKYKSIGRKNHDGCDPERTIVVRSKYGNYPVLFYENFKGMTSDTKQMTLIKQDYHYATGCNYYQTRPILLSTWLELDPVRQNCTCVVDKQD